MKIAAKTLLLFHVAVCSTQVHGFALPLLSPIFNSPQSSPCSNGRGHRGVRFLTQQLHASSDRTSVDRAFNLPRPPISALEETPSRFYDPLDQQAGPNDQSMQRPDQQDTVLPWTALLSAAVWTLVGDPLPAEAAAAAVTGGVVPSALWAYGHYLAMLLVVGSLVTERSLIQPQMSRDDEKALGRADLVYLASLVLLIVSGSFRATEFGKGMDFYSHEILFWLKMSFVGVLAGCALFPSITLLRRNDQSPPISEKLAARLKQVVNAELHGFVFIPLAATFMARGVTYVNDFPWPIGAVFAVAASGGACYFYGKQALTWSDDESIESKDSDKAT